MNIWLSCCNMPWQKVTALPTSHTGAKISGNNHFGVPMHFKTNRFTFKKFSTPPPLLHPILSLFGKELELELDLNQFKKIDPRGFYSVGSISKNRNNFEISKHTRIQA